MQKRRKGVSSKKNKVGDSSDSIQTVTDSNNDPELQIKDIMVDVDVDNEVNNVSETYQSTCQK